MLEDLKFRYLYLLTHLKRTLFGFGKLFYSENGEDAFLMSVIFKGKNDGFYVDVGGFHPKLLSNTYALYKRGWSGVNIDPNKDAIRLFNWYRPRDTNLALGVGVAGTGEYHRFAHAGRNTFSAYAKEEFEKKPYTRYLGSEQIEIIPLTTVFEKYAKKDIDLLTVDVEGMDLAVLETNDWDRFRPKVVLVEDWRFDTDNPSASPVYAFMSKRGYRLRAFIGYTLVFQERDRSSVLSK